ncbi:MAG TPA: carboxypeptidase-like regulatory domain-containing protein [Gemmatimonadales bacterium]|nr:carboxypeptidase-like regulatory domain-containing protein [Gemmatimonadales bacterium]
MTATFSVRHLAHLALMMVALAATVTRAGVAQTSTGTIRGTVTDEGGAPLSGASIMATNVASGVERAAASDDRGFYALPGLTPGTYDVRVRHIGHAPQGNRVQVQIGQSLTLNFRLASSPVEVQDIAVVTVPIAETQTSEVATNVTEAQIERLPSPSRNFLDLATLAPGITVSSAGNPVGGWKFTRLSRFW